MASGHTGNGNSSGKNAAEKPHSDKSRWAGAGDSTKTPLDPDLASIVAAWPTLPEAIKAGIVAMIRATGK